MDARVKLVQRTSHVIHKVQDSRHGEALQQNVSAALMKGATERAESVRWSVFG